jgi:CheY-like chemotaxis protein
MIYENLTFSPGDYLIREGEVGKGFYILDSGELEVIRDGKVINEIDMSGGIFGEMSDILGVKRDASIRAKSNTKVKYFEVSLGDFVVQNPKLAVKIIRNLGRRLSRMNSLVIEGNTRNDFLKSISAGNHQNTESSIRLLVVDDKPMIISQVSDLVSPLGWHVDGVAETDAAYFLAESEDFSAFLISCTLPENGAIELRRKLKTNPRSSKTPVVGLMVQGDDYSMRKATDAGFSDFLTKPFDRDKVISRLYEIIDLDPSDQYFDSLGNILLFKVPKELSPYIFDQIKGSYNNRIKDTINDGVGNVVVDLSDVDDVGEDVVDLVGEFAELIEEMGSPFKLAFVVTGEDSEMWKNLDGCEEAEIFESLEDAKSQMT